MFAFLRESVNHLWYKNSVTENLHVTSMAIKGSSMVFNSIEKSFYSACGSDLAHRFSISMGESMIVSPCLVMIFAHGIE